MPATFTDQLRDVIRKCGVTRYAIAKATGIDQSMLSRFMSGRHGLPPSSLDALGKLLKLKVYAGRSTQGRPVLTSPLRNVDSFRIRCINNTFDSVISQFPKIGFKDWEADERRRISRERDEPVKLSHYRLDSPLGLKHLPPALRREYGLDQPEQPNGITRFVIRLDDGAGCKRWYFAAGGDAPTSFLTTGEIALAQKWSTQVDAERVLHSLFATRGVSRADAEVEEVAAETSFSLTLGGGDWPDAIEVREQDGARLLLVRDSGEEATSDLDDDVAGVLVRVLAKLRTRVLPLHNTETD